MNIYVCARLIIMYTHNMTAFIGLAMILDTIPVYHTLYTWDVDKRMWVIFLGRQHLANIELCSCQDDALFFVQQGLWPASPCNPQFCFQFKFLDRVESLLLENQTSLKGFCDGIKEALPKLIKDNV